MDASNEAVLEAQVIEEVSVVPRPPSRMPRWVVASILVHLGLLALVVLAASTISGRLELLQAQGQEQREHLDRATDRTNALVLESQQLRHEVQSLRQHMLSTTGEDVIFLKATILKPDLDPELARLIAKNVHRFAELYGRDADLVLAMIAVESNFDPKAVSSVGAVGLMQVMPQWKKVLGITGDLTDPEISIKHGLQILGFYDEMYKDLEMALTAYNRGPGTVDWALMKGQNPRNNYAPKVLASYAKLKRLTVASTGT